MKISVCMATYNGEKYLKQQIDSILSQSNQEWQLLIRDDGSHDNTISIIKDYIARYPDKIRLIRDNESHLGACLNFGRLLEYSDTEYIMFSDQDDVWLPNKIELTLNAMKSAERACPNKAVLVHTDLKVVDSNLKTIADSMWIYQKLSPDIGNDPNKIMVQNVVSGCTVMINRKAKSVSVPIPREAVMHGWWIAINVAKYGKIAYVRDSTILYRQHTKNKIGAQRINILYFLKKICCLKNTLSACYGMFRMIKKVDANANFWLLMFNKVAISLARIR